MAKRTSRQDRGDALLPQRGDASLSSIRVRVGTDEIQLDVDSRRWSSVHGRETEDTLATLATLAGVGHFYSPSDGIPGYALATHVARELGGKAILPPVRPGASGTVY